MGELRQKFEALPQVSLVINAFAFDEINNEYKAVLTIPEYTVGAINGMWVMFQDKQSKIEQLEKEISTFKERIKHAEKFINQIPCQSTWEAESRQDAMKALRNGKRFKEPKKLPHTHIFISSTCECGWTVDQEKALRGES